MKDKKIKMTIAMINTIDGFKGDGFFLFRMQSLPFPMVWEMRNINADSE
jgi:hypothetical protein